MNAIEELALLMNQVTGADVKLVEDKLRHHFGGQEVYFPKTSHDKRNEAIRKAHDGRPDSYRRLAAIHGLSERRIREIVHGR